MLLVTGRSVRRGLFGVVLAVPLLAGCSSGSNLAYPSLFADTKSKGVVLTKAERDAMIQDLSSEQGSGRKASFDLK